jgi:hypothetical protein
MPSSTVLLMGVVTPTGSEPYKVRKGGFSHYSNRGLMNRLVWETKMIYIPATTEEHEEAHQALVRELLREVRRRLVTKLRAKSAKR